MSKMSVNNWGVQITKHIEIYWILLTIQSIKGRNTKKQRTRKKGKKEIQRNIKGG
jgi:hypothetical protein